MHLETFESFVHKPIPNVLAQELQNYVAHIPSTWGNKTIRSIIRSMGLGLLHAATLQTLRKQLFKDLDTILQPASLT